MNAAPFIVTEPRLKRAVKHLERIAATAPSNPAFETLFASACDAGQVAADLIDLSKVSDGFGFVTVKLGKGAKKSEFAKWMKAKLAAEGEKYPEDDYYGVHYPIPSLDKYGGVVKREAYAEAFARIISAAGFPAFPTTRLD